MTWQQVRQHYPNQWVIMEALKANSNGDRRIFEQLGVLESCEDNAELFPRYKKLRAEFPGKEIIFYHSSREELDMPVRSWHGARLPK